MNLNNYIRLRWMAGYRAHLLLDEAILRIQRRFHTIINLFCFYWPLYSKVRLFLYLVVQWYSEFVTNCIFSISFAHLTANYSVLVLVVKSQRRYLKFLASQTFVINHLRWHIWIIHLISCINMYGAISSMQNTLAYWGCCFWWWHQWSEIRDYTPRIF